MGNSKPQPGPGVSKFEIANAFAEQYLALRKKEQRVYTDEQVRQLPLIGADHPHYKEWQIRKRSADQLLKFLGNIHTPASILEVGCGNGWLSHRLSAIHGVDVTGYDINQAELQQAKKIFGHRLNLRFTSADPFSEQGKLYDVIVFAAAIQYFPSLNSIISKALEKLSPNGSIHIMDSHFYKPGEVAAARQRTADYFSSIGFAGMSANYFHHSLDELKPFKYKILYNPASAWNRLVNKDPFHWICIKKN